MNTPIATTRPLSMADALADIRFHQQCADSATKALLIRHGWRHTCMNPARLWLWAKKFPDGRTVLTDLDTALAIESALAGQPPVPAALAATSASPAAPTKLPRLPLPTRAKGISSP